MRSFMEVEAGTYNFNKAQAPFDPLDVHSNSTACTYAYKFNSKVIKIIVLYSDINDQIQAISTEDINNKWTVKSSENDGVVANCYSDQPSSCPLIKKN